jgi:alpha-tubulin suppressor-like RCC1 family protein
MKRPFCVSRTGISCLPVDVSLLLAVEQPCAGILTSNRLRADERLMRRSFASCTPVTLVAWVLLGCGDKPASTTTDPEQPSNGSKVSVVRIGPRAISLFRGFSQQFNATVRDLQGNVMAGRVVSWTSSNPEVIAIGSSGLAKANAPGIATIKAETDARSDTVQITVAEPGGEAGFYSAVTAGEAHTCALTTSRTAFCWGHNLYGQLGTDVALPSSSVPHTNTPVPVAGGHSFVALSTRYFHTCGLTTEGEAYCWGWNGLGGLGDGTTDNSSLPVRVATDLRFASITAGYRQTCAVTASGAAYCWGGNGIGEVGDGSYADKLKPSLVAGNIVFASVSAGLNHTCGIATSGKAYCWGWNQFGMLGDGQAIESSNVPVAVSSNIEFSGLSSGRYLYTCGLSNTRDGYCWGRNAGGALGINAEEPFRSTPSLVEGGHSFTSIGTGYEHSCATSTTGAAYCWGSNYNGKLGNPGIFEYTLLPARVQLPNVAFALVVAGTEHSCALSSLGAIYCWGGNLAGSLGTGTDSSTALPSLVRNPP